MKSNHMLSILAYKINIIATAIAKINKIAISRLMRVAFCQQLPNFRVEKDY